MTKTKKLGKRACEVLRSLKPSYGHPYDIYPIRTINKLLERDFIEPIGISKVRTTDSGWDAYLKECKKK